MGVQADDYVRVRPGFDRIPQIVGLRGVADSQLVPGGRWVTAYPQLRGIEGPLLCMLADFEVDVVGHRFPSPRERFLRGQVAS